MKRFVLLFLLIPLLGACDKEESVVQTWTVASEKGVAGVWFGFGFVPADIVKKSSDGGWELFTGTIDGFVFEEGYESRIRVRIDPIANPPADGPVNRYTMERLISRTPARSVDKDDFSPAFDVLVASQRGTYYDFDCYWIKDLRYPDPRWEPLPVEIDGFEYEPGFEYTLSVKATAEKSPETGKYGIRLTLLEEYAKEEVESEGLPE